MLVTPKKNRLNRLLAFLLAAVVATVFVVLGFFYPWSLVGVLLGPFAFWWMRRRCRRRAHLMARPFPQVWEAVLRGQVAYFNALGESECQRFRQMVKIFLDETRITGIRTEVDEPTRVLVAASAIIPVFQFPDWEYSTLGEVLIYPGSFDDNYQTSETGQTADDGQHDILGMVGMGHLSGVMILSKPSLHSGFDIHGDKHNVGIHEFVHLVDKADGSIDGLPPGIDAQISRSWIQWVGEELAGPPQKRSHIRPYAYTNEAEYFAVLAEYFFEAPAVLEQKNPPLYRLLEKMFRQDTASFLPGIKPRRHRLGRNKPCPCGSGKKYKRCCLRKAKQGVPR